MEVISPILGNFEGRLGGVSGYRKNGKDILQAVPLARPYARTQAQLDQQNRLAFLARYAKIAAPILQYGFPRLSGGNTARTEFVRQNKSIQLMQLNETWVIEGFNQSKKLIFTRPELPPPPISYAYLHGNTFIEFSFPDPLPDHYIICVIGYDWISSHPYHVHAMRSDGTVDFYFDPNIGEVEYWENQVIKIWYYDPETQRASAATTLELQL